VVAGLAGSGADVLLVGVEPTPAVAFLTQALDADFGIMLSASHNPMPDNGIKIFARGGLKLDDAVEDAIEAGLVERALLPTGRDVGRVHAVSDAGADYIDHLLGTLRHSLSGLKVVVDCANGAASAASPEALRRAGAEVVAIHADPDGWNINDRCGSTHLDQVMAAVQAHGADLGIAHDGDADRCLAVDAHGNAVDGDQILAILALALRDRSQLTRDSVVATVMSNLGFHNAMRASGVGVVSAAVGDRYVLEAMREGGYVLGGEQSGHIIMLDHATTGDGLLTALQLMDRMVETGATLAELAGVMQRLPQVLINVTGVDRGRLASAAAVRDAVAAAEEALGDEGRVLLRPSGTEPVVRVMVEAPTVQQAEYVAQGIADVVRVALA
jgi:phosphoglucosamine mutase